MISRLLVRWTTRKWPEALEYALDNHPDADTTVLYVVGEPSPMWGKATGLALEDLAEAVFDRARELAGEYDIDIDTDGQIGNAARSILNRADGFDAVVIGSHGRSVADRLFVGDVAQKMFRRSPVPVIVVR